MLAMVKDVIEGVFATITAFALVAFIFLSPVLIPALLLMGLALGFVIVLKGFGLVVGLFGFLLGLIF
jgi:hypothetical protein